MKLLLNKIITGSISVNDPLLCYDPESWSKKRDVSLNQMIVHFALYKELTYKHSLKKIEGISVIINNACRFRFIYE